MLFTQYVVHINSVSQYLLGGVHLLFTYYSNRTKSRVSYQPKSTIYKSHVIEQECLLRRLIDCIASVME
jgi:hypothetical protein